MRVAPALLDWYDRTARDLPWRRTRDPYAILVSEFMLQQTQVQTVIPYYQTFLERFPTLEALADASVDEVLRVWKGLGYYRRARNLHKAAQALVGQYEAAVPMDYDAIRALPGVGEYTAAAVGSIAFNLPYPVLDGNVARVVSRLQCIDAPVDKSATKREMNTFLIEELPQERSGDFNQAMMELGATVCLPVTPECPNCPLRGMCLAHESGRERELPVKSNKESVKVEQRTVVLAWVGERVRLRRRPEEGLLALMWEFPHALGHGPQSAKSILQEITPELEGSVNHQDPSKSITDGWQMRSLGLVEHRFSHLLWRLEVVEARLNVIHPTGVREWEAKWSAVPEEDAVWVTPSEVEEMALPRAMQRVWRRTLGSDQQALPF